jgi:hypothetical protein
MEWRSIPESPDSSTRVAKLNSILSKPSKPPRFCVLDLLAYFEDYDIRRLCFVSRLPTSSTLPPISLYHLLSRISKIPPLGTRFRMTQILAASVLELHCSSWMHRRIRSSNILFFRYDALHMTPRISCNHGYQDLDTPILMATRRATMRCHGRPRTPKTTSTAIHESNRTVNGDLIVIDINANTTCSVSGWCCWKSGFGSSCGWLSSILLD